MGQVVGETDARAERAKGKPCTPQNGLATIYHVLGIDPGRSFPDYQGRARSSLRQPRKDPRADLTVLRRANLIVGWALLPVALLLCWPMAASSAAVAKAIMRTHTP